MINYWNGRKIMDKQLYWLKGPGVSENPILHKSWLRMNTKVVYCWILVLYQIQSKSCLWIISMILTVFSVNEWQNLLAVVHGWVAIVGIDQKYQNYEKLSIQGKRFPDETGKPSHALKSDEGLAFYYATIKKYKFWHSNYLLWYSK